MTPSVPAGAAGTTRVPAPSPFRSSPSRATARWMRPTAWPATFLIPLAIASLRAVERLHRAHRGDVARRALAGVHVDGRHLGAERHGNLHGIGADSPRHGWTTRSPACTHARRSACQRCRDGVRAFTARSSEALVIAKVVGQQHEMTAGHDDAGGRSRRGYRYRHRLVGTRRVPPAWHSAQVSHGSPPGTSTCARAGARRCRGGVHGARYFVTENERERMSACGRRR